MEIINNKNIQKTKNFIKEFKKNKKTIIVTSQDEGYDRKVLEIKDVNIFLLDLIDRKDRLKQRDSGLNEYMSKLAKKNNIKIGIDLDDIIKLNKNKKAIVLSRLIQNINLCKRTGCEIIVLNSKKYHKNDIISFFLSLKSSSTQAKKAF